MISKFSINKQLEVGLIFLIIILAFSSRTYFWLYGYNEGVNGLFIHGDGYYEMAKSLINGTYNLNSYRFYQIIYPFYLSPVFLFDLNPNIYVFILHHSFVVLTTLFIFLSGKKLNGVISGLIASFLYSIHFQIAFWFNFTLSDICFHFHLALLMFVYIKLFNKIDFLSNFVIIIFSIVLGFIRPEGFLIFLTIIFLILFRILTNLISIKSTFLIIFSFIIGFIFITNLLVFNNKNITNKLMSNVHIGWGLYYGSQMSATTPGEVDTMLYEMFDTCQKKSDLDENNRNSWWWCSKLGIDRIKEDPTNYIKVILNRIPSVFFPSFYREGVSFKYKFVTISFMSFIISGLIFLLMTKRLLNSSKNELILYLFIMSLPTYLMVIFYQNEWDIRIQLSSQVILLTISSIGWINLIYVIMQKINFFDKKNY